MRMLSLPVAGPGPQGGSPSRGGTADPQTQAAQQQDAPPEPCLVVFSGGTAFNSVAGHMRQLTTRIAHVLPVSDDGGSTAEIVRVLGGPAVGDIRSRCLRLAGEAPASGMCQWGGVTAGGVAAGDWEGHCDPTACRPSSHCQQPP